MKLEREARSCGAWKAFIFSWMGLEQETNILGMMFLEDHFFFFLSFLMFLNIILCFIKIYLIIHLQNLSFNDVCT